MLLSCCSEKLPSQSVSEYNLGVEAYKAGKYHQAVSYFEKAIETEPANTNSLLMLALIYDDCLDSRYFDQRKQDKLKAIEYYEKYISNGGDSPRITHVKKWLDNCRLELVAIDSGVSEENIDADDAVDREKAIENLKQSLDDIAKKYVLRLENINDLTSKIRELNAANEDLKSKMASARPSENPISSLSWILLIILVIVIAALAWALRSTPRVTEEPEEPVAVSKKPIETEKILGSYIWVESVHNRGIMAISKDEMGYLVETRAINTSAVSSGYGKYNDNILEAVLMDENGEGAQMRFEFFEDGRAFVASWEDELGHGSAVGLRNEFDEMVRPEYEEKKPDA